MCQEQIMSCTLGNGAQTLSVCLNGSDAVYRFGPTGATPDLEITTPIGTVDYLPWPGIGRTIWESVSFINDDHIYEVGTGFDRTLGDGDADTPVAFGGVSIRKNGTEIAALRCDEGSVDWGYGGGLYDAKTALGLCWSRWPDNIWLPCAQE